jgi:hypothetical protein
VTATAGSLFEGAGEVARRRESLLVAAMGFVALGGVLVLMWVPLWGPIVEEGLAITLLIAWATNAYPVRKRGTLRVTGGGLFLDQKLLVARNDIASAYRLSAAEPIVRIMPRRSTPLDVRLPEDEHAGQLLDALGLAVGQSVASFRAVAGKRPLLPYVLVLATSAAMGFGTLGGVLLLHHLGLLAAVGRIAPLGPMFLFAPLLFVVYARMALRVDVGSDGILLHRLFDRRFISHASLESVTADGLAVVLRLRSGAVVTLSTGTSSAQLEARDALVRRIEEAHAAFVEEHGAENAEALIAPGGRPPERWLREIRALARARDYRETRLDADGLWRVLDDATASPGTRAGAARALSALDQGSRTRLRVSAESCAEPKLRIALLRVAEGAADAELEEALTPLLDSKSS